MGRVGAVAEGVAAIEGEIEGAGREGFGIDVCLMADGLDGTPARGRPRTNAGEKGGQEMRVALLVSGRGWYRRSGLVWLVGGLLVLAVALPGGASAASDITFVAPAGALAYPDQTPEGPAGYTEAPDAFRTTQVQPVIGIQADAGTQLECHADSVFDTQTCGPGLPGCTAAVCASYQPASPLAADSTPGFGGLFLAVDLLDADGDTIDSQWLKLDVDTTAPDTVLDTIDGPSRFQNPFRPTFTFEVNDENTVGGHAIDHADCSWTTARQNPAWAACPLKFGDGSYRPAPLAHRHHLYAFAVRGTDDFGRSTIASGEYDPVPCTLTVQPPRTLSALLSAGVRMQVSCDTLPSAEVGVYAYALNGRRYATPRGAVAELPMLGRVSLKSTTPAFTAKRLMRLSTQARHAFRNARSLSLVFAAGEPDDLQAGIANDTLSYTTLTLHR
jgi:hypothetical protein